MLKWLKKGDDAAGVSRLAATIQDKVKNLPKVPTRRPRQGTPWASWTLRQKVCLLGSSLPLLSACPQEDCFKEYKTNGLRGLQLRHGSGCPPGSTIRTWGQRLRDVGRLQPVGRPKSLTGVEEEAVATAVTNLRAAGAVVDSEVLINLGRSAAGEARGAA